MIIASTEDSNEGDPEKHSRLMRMNANRMSPLICPSCACLHSVPLFLCYQHSSHVTHGKKKKHVKCNFTISGLIYKVTEAQDRSLTPAGF